MWQKLVLVIGLMLATSITASGQAIQLFGGYSYQRFDGTPSVNLSGWEVAGRVRLISWLGGVADVAGHYGSPSSVNMRTVTATFGPEISVPTRISPFFHVLGGVGRIRIGSATDTSFATTIGGGVDWRLVPFVSWRVVQIDDVRTRFFGSTQHNARISTGIVLRF